MAKSFETTEDVPGVPKGFRKIEVGQVSEVWSDGKTLILVGQPPDEEELANVPEEEWHNCDQMGCNWSHVVLSCQINQDSIVK